MKLISTCFFCCFVLIVEQMVKLLLNKGANLSAIDKKERQPIHCAAYLGKQVSISCLAETINCD